MLFCNSDVYVFWEIQYLEGKAVKSMFVLDN